MKIYLSGSIQNLSYGSASVWRDAAKEILEPEHQTLNPLRNRMWKEAKEQAQFNINELVHRDILDVEKCDVLLVEMTNPNRNYVGTVTEMTIAREIYRKPIVVFVGEHRLKNDESRYSFWVDYLATKVVATMEEAIKYICEVLDYDKLDS